MQIYLSITPEQLRDAARYTRCFAHVAYRVGPESTLLRHNLLVQTRGGLLSLSDRDAPEVTAPEKLCAAALRECGRRGYGGVVLDFESKSRGDLLVLAGALERQLRRSRLAFFVPESYGGAVESAAVLVGTAISGGNFVQRLREAVKLRGAGRLALDVERLAMDFPLPCPGGQGRFLPRSELAALMEREAPAVFFSPDLCARYFTYTHAGETHFVLFDDGDTLVQKLRMGQNLGAAAAFLQYPEVEDLLPKLFGKA